MSFRNAAMAKGLQAAAAFSAMAIGGRGLIYVHSEAQDALRIKEDRPPPGWHSKGFRNGQEKPASAGFLLSGGKCRCSWHRSRSDAENLRRLLPKKKNEIYTAALQPSLNR